MAFFRNLPIKQKMTVAVLGTTSLSLLLACGTFVAYERMNSRRAMARNLTVLADALARNSVVALSFGKGYEEDAGKILKALNAEPAVAAACLYTAAGALHGTYLQPGVEAKFPPKPGKDGTRIEDGMMMVVRPVIDEVKETPDMDNLDDASAARPVKTEHERIGTIYLRADLAGVNARLRLYAGISGLILLASFLVALALSAALQRLILRPILALTGIAQRMAETRDYTARAQKLSGDELGVLTDAFNQMLDDIQERTGALQHANESLRSQASEMTAAAGVLATSASQIVAATQELAASAADAASAVSETTTTVEEVRQASQLSSERAKSVSDQAQNAADVAKGGKSSVNRTIEGMNGIRDQMSAIAECILSLSAQSQTIGEIIASVDDLAAQSKLLAVNAAIEAAKAGEEGRGFSVVAQEVRSLAEQSKQATLQVRGILSDIQKATSSAVLATEQGGKAVEAGVQQSAAAGESIGALAESIAGAAQAAAQIAATSRQQFAGMEQVAMAMGSIKSASTQTLSSTRQVEGAARQLHELGEKLKQLVGQFKV